VIKIVFPHRIDLKAYLRRSGITNESPNCNFSIEWRVSNRRISALNERPLDGAPNSRWFFYMLAVRLGLAIERRFLRNTREVDRIF
jgi:hypothetical protein